jgi:hypothetical protein
MITTHPRCPSRSRHGRSDGIHRQALMRYAVHLRRMWTYACLRRRQFAGRRITLRAVRQVGTTRQSGLTDERCRHSRSNRTTFNYDFRPAGEGSRQECLGDGARHRTPSLRDQRNTRGTVGHRYAAGDGWRCVRPESWMAAAGRSRLLHGHGHCYASRQAGGGTESLSIDTAV